MYIYSNKYCKRKKEKGNNMVIRKNNKNRTHFLYEVYGNVETFISTPFKGAKKATKLTIRSTDGSRVDLNGRQVRILRSVLDKATKLSA